MNLKYIFLLFLLGMSTTIWGQALINTFEKNQQAIQLVKSLTGEEGSYIAFNENKAPLLVSLNNLAINKLHTVENIFPSQTEKKSVIIDPLNYPRYGVMLTQHFNYPILHTSPTSSVSVKNHTVYLGPEYNILLTKPSQDSAANWQPDHWGLNLGYRCHISSENKKLNLFVQLNLSFYQVKYTKYNYGTGEPPTTHEKMTIENTGGLGLNYKLNKRIEIFGGIGFGSTNGFFLLFRNFIPHSFAGLSYKIK